MHDLKVENCVLFGGITEDLSAGHSLSALRDCSEEVREEPGCIGVFCKQTKKQPQKPGSQTPKNYC